MFNLSCKGTSQLPIFPTMGMGMGLITSHDILNLKLKHFWMTLLSHMSPTNLLFISYLSLALAVVQPQFSVYASVTTTYRHSSVTGDCEFGEDSFPLTSVTE